MSEPTPPPSCQMPCDTDCEIGPVHCWNHHRPNHKPDWHDPQKCDAQAQAIAGNWMTAEQKLGVS